jgi:hypothetical protein
MFVWRAKLKPSELIEAIERFFLDLIAYLLPGSALIVAWITVLSVPGSWQRDFGYSEQHPAIIYLFCFAAYVLGQILETAGNLITWPTVAKAASLLQKILPQGIQRFLGISKILSKEKIEEAIVNSSSVKHAIGVLRDRTAGSMKPPVNDLHGWRSRAMSDISPDQIHVVYRFMFISILSLGMSSVCVFVGSAAIFFALANLASPWTHSSNFPPAPGWSATAACFVLAYFFILRRAEFYSRAMHVPFSMASAKQDDVKRGDADCAKASSRPTIYLAGGMRSNWQDRVISELPMFSFFDPRTHGLKDPDAYTHWDLEAVRKSDWVLAFLEETNPGGFSLALEMGFARALSKRMILVDEKSARNEEASRRLAMLHSIADYCPSTIDEAIVILSLIGRDTDVHNG